MDKYDELIRQLMENPELQTTYDTCIIKDITFKEWVVGHVDDLLMKRPIRHAEIAGFKNGGVYV